VRVRGIYTHFRDLSHLLGFLHNRILFLGVVHSVPFKSFYITPDQVSSVDTATDYRLDCRGIGLLWGPHTASYPVGTGALSSDIKRPEREAKNMCSYNSTAPCVCMACYGDSFTLYSVRSIIVTLHGIFGG
jgi:hypothetical protein